MSFSSLGLADYLLQSVEQKGYKTPTSIQEKAIPLILEGRDVIGQAQTGTGKTAGFSLPILQMLCESEVKKTKKANILGLILTPTRELALQVAKAMEVYAQFTAKKVRILPVIGGEDIEEQEKHLRAGHDIVVATPGRLLELVERESIRLLELRYFVLDEADKMLDLGFSEELDTVIASLPASKQSLLFSATFPDRLLKLAHTLLKDPAHITIEDETPTVEAITQRAIEVNRDNRSALLRHLIKTENLRHVLVFVASKRASRNLAAKLIRDGISAAEFNGNLTQDQRTKVLRQFENRNVDILISTDIAARGIDITKLPCVINYDLPRSPRDYIHRIGRTGRAGHVGMAISFIGHEDQAHFKLIMKRAEVEIPRESIEGFELVGEPPPKKKGKPPVKGRRKSKKDKAREAAKRNQIR